jgi:hypothetical protein
MAAGRGGAGRSASKVGWVKQVVHARYRFDAINFYLVINLFSRSGFAMRTNRIH